MKHQMPRILSACVVLALAVLAPSVAHAAMAPDAAFTSLADAIYKGIQELANSAPLESFGWQLLSFLLVTNVVWTLIKGYFSGSGLHGAFADLVPVAVAGVVATAFMGGAGTVTLISALEATMNVIGSQMTGVPMNSVSTLMVEAAVKSLETIGNLLGTSPNAARELNFSTALVQILLAVPGTIMGIIATVVATFLVLLALGMYMAHLVISQITIEIAKMFAPIFVPFLVWRPAAWLFEGWLRFFIGAALLKIVGFILLQVTNVMMEQVLELSQQVEGMPESSVFSMPVFDVTKYAVIILMSGIGALMMSKAPSIASGLLSGSGAHGFGGWGEISSKSPATRMLMGGMGSSGGGSSPRASGENAASGITRMMPNVAKPITSAAGSVASYVGGKAMAMKDAATARNKGDGTREISRDMSQMSAATQRAYTSHLEARNSRSASQANKPSFYGPPSPRITVASPQSSIAPSRRPPDKT